MNNKFKYFVLRKSAQKKWKAELDIAYKAMVNILVSIYKLFVF